MKEIHPEVVAGYNDLVGVIYRFEMTPDLQSTFCENTAFQGYMWTPCLNQAKVLPTGEYWFDLLVPNAELEICVKAYATGIPHLMFFHIYRSGNLVAENKSVMTGNYFYENLADYIALITKGGQFLTIKVSQDTLDVNPFTVFYRIKG